MHFCVTLCNTALFYHGDACKMHYATWYLSREGNLQMTYRLMKISHGKMHVFSASGAFGTGFWTNPLAKKSNDAKKCKKCKMQKNANYAKICKYPGFWILQKMQIMQLAFPHLLVKKSSLFFPCVLTKKFRSRDDFLSPSEK